MQSDHEDKLQELLKEAFSVTLTELTDVQVLMEMDEWDSLSHMQFIMALETAFGFELTGDEIADMQSIGDVKTVILTKALPTT